MKMTKQGRILAVAAGVAICAAGTARADEASERQMAARLREVEARLAEVERGGYFTASSDLEARVSDLERTFAADDRGGMVSYFKAGMKSESTDGANKYQWFGRVQDDFFWFDAPTDAQTALGEMNGGSEFRRVRLGVAGTLYGNTNFKAELDFANAAVEFTDVYVELANCGFGNVRAGHFDEPFGLDRLTSSKYSTFVERNLIAEAFVPARNNGVMLWDNFGDDAYLYQVGIFRDSDGAGNDLGNKKSGEYNVTGRISGRPIIADDGATFLHLGLAASLRDYSNDTVQYRARPNVHGAPRFVDTGAIADQSDGTLWNLEAAYQTGPFNIQAEYCKVNTNAASDTTADDYSFDAFSIQTSYWLTGDMNTYDKKAGRFDRPKIKKNYGDADGMGGWQLALRYDTIDLSDGSLTGIPGSTAGGELQTWTVGVNWWLNSNTHIALNFVDADRKNLDDNVRAMVLRFAIDF